MTTEPRFPDPVLAGLVGRLLVNDALVWRHHKNGLLQAYVAEGLTLFDTELRLHVWHPSLILSDEDSGRRHDHRFRLTSRVLLGAIHDTEFAVRHEWEKQAQPPTSECYQIWNIQNARRAQASGEHWVRLEDDRVYSVTESNHVYNMGSTYSYPPRVFHRSDVKELTVTVCTKREQSDVPARLLAKVGATPTHAFDPGPSQGPRDAKAHAGLLREAGEQLLHIARKA